ncbi:MAG: hypothetical protein ACR2M3_21115 [Thermomicrobiales bacterium]
MANNDDSHPADQLIHDLIAHPRAATDEEIRLITDRIATAPFNPAIQKVSIANRRFAYQGATPGRQTDSLTLHLIQRVMRDRQWAMGTTAMDYLRSLHAAARSESVQIALYRQWEERDIAVIIARTRTVLGEQQLGARSETNLIVVYRADRGILVSGYQFSTMDEIAIPDDALWLK